MVGGGSVQWTANIVKDMLLTEGISNSEFILLDIDRKASDLTAAFLTRLGAELKSGARFVSTDDRKEALAGADYVIITISTGGLKAMAHDLAIPERYGIYHTVGDTSGPGGWARCIRNFGVFAELAKDIRRLAPGAVVLNYTTPMTTLTAVLARLYPWRVVDGAIAGIRKAGRVNAGANSHGHGMDLERGAGGRMSGIGRPRALPAGLKRLMLGASLIGKGRRVDGRARMRLPGEPRRAGWVRTFAPS